MLKIPQAVFNETDLPAGTQQRLKYVRDYKQKTLASGSMNYIEQYDQNLNSVYVTLYEASSPAAAYEIQQKLIGKRRELTGRLKKLGAAITHPGASGLEHMSANLPDKTQQYIVDFKNRDTGKTLQFVSSFLIEGRYLIAVSNVDDNELNREALLKTLQNLRAS